MDKSYSPPDIESRLEPRRRRGAWAWQAAAAIALVAVSSLITASLVARGLVRLEKPE